MNFEPIFFAERLNVFNPSGDVAITTLWSKVDSAVQMLERGNIDLDPASSRISVIANLYGNGLPQMLRNLMYNPQIQHLVIMGKNLSGSREWLTQFFKDGLEQVEFLGQPFFRIRGTSKMIDGGVLPSDFSQKVNCYPLGDISSEETIGVLQNLLQQIPLSNVDLSRIAPPAMPEPSLVRFPSEPRSHTIVRSSPIDAWKELIFRLYRFGHRNKVQKKTGPEERVELQNLHVVIEDPTEESNEALNEFGFDLNKFRGYQQRILDPVKPPDLGYTYGNRLRGYFVFENQPVDSIQIAAERLKKDPDSRHAYISTWDSNNDLPKGTGCPCLVSIYFRKFENKLTLTATFRTHNAVDAWLENIYGLIGIQRYVSDVCGIERGAITVISHSISIDPSSLERAKTIALSKETDEVVDLVTGKLGPRFDHNGEFTITVDREKGEIVVEHSYSGIRLGEYRGRTSESIERQISRDNAVSEISHALYLGRELAKAETLLKRKVE